MLAMLLEIASAWVLAAIVASLGLGVLLHLREKAHAARMEAVTSSELKA